MGKLHEKDTQFAFNLAAKDEEIEKLRVSLQGASSERSAARAALAARQDDIDELRGRARQRATLLLTTQRLARRSRRCG